VKMLSPFAPHLSEELWSKLGHRESISGAPWPSYDAAMLVEDEVEYAVQVNGKVRARVTVAADAAEDSIRAAALALPEIAASLSGKAPKKVIVVKGKLVSVVA